MAGGILCALVTPFNADGGVDEAALENLIRWQLAETASLPVYIYNMPQESGGGKS